MVSSLTLLLTGFYATCVLLPPVTGDGNLITCESESDPVIYDITHHQVYDLDAGIINKKDLILNFQGMMITCIKAITYWNGGTGGTATLKSGGLGQSTATVLLQGKRFRGYSFHVTVRGKPAEQEQATPTTDIDIDVRIAKQSFFCHDSSKMTNIFEERLFVPILDMD